MINRKNRILFAIILMLTVQVNCKATQSQYPTSMPTPVLANIPKSLVRGKEYQFSVQTILGAECQAGIAYSNFDDRWIIRNLPTIKSDKDGVCEWTWKIPKDAKDGIGEFRAHIDVQDQSINTFPATFCIGICP